MYGQTDKHANLYIKPTLWLDKDLHLMVVVEAGFKLKMGDKLRVVVVGNVHHAIPDCW